MPRHISTAQNLELQCKPWNHKQTSGRRFLSTKFQEAKRGVDATVKKAQSRAQSPFRCQNENLFVSQTLRRPKLDTRWQGLHSDPVPWRRSWATARGVWACASASPAPRAGARGRCRWIAPCCLMCGCVGAWVRAWNSRPLDSVGARSSSDGRRREREVRPRATPAFVRPSRLGFPSHGSGRSTLDFSLGPVTMSDRGRRYFQPWDGSDVVRRRIGNQCPIP